MPGTLYTNGANISGTVAYFQGFDTIAYSPTSLTAAVSLTVTGSGTLDLTTQLLGRSASVTAAGSNLDITTSSGNDTLTSTGANNTLRGGAGNDRFNGGASIYGGEGDDTIAFKTSMTHIDGGTGTDSVYLTYQRYVSQDLSNVSLDGLENLYTRTPPAIAETVRATGPKLQAFTTIADSPGDLTARVGIDLTAPGTVDLSSQLLGRGVDFDGSTGDDVITTSNGNDIVGGGGGSDTIHTGAGNDRIVAYSGDTIAAFGEDGSDLFQINGGVTGTIDGGADIDTLDAHDLRGLVISNVEILTTDNAIGTAAQFGRFTIIRQGVSSTGPVTLRLAEAGTVDLSTQLLGLNLTFRGTVGNDGVTASDGADTLSGDWGDDSLNGGAGNDTIDGSDGADILNGGDGDDLLIGGLGGDALDGGSGIDTASYVYSQSGVAVDLAARTASGGDAQGDSLVSIENLIGSAFADSLVGDAADNDLEGGAGGDHLVGGGGIDTASYAHSSAGVTVNLLLGTASGGDAEGDTFDNTGNLGANSIENLIGTEFNDDLTAMPFGSVFGLGGNDTLHVSGFGQGSPTADGGAGNDTIVVAIGTNAIVNGGAGNDSLQFSGDGKFHTLVGVTVSNVETLYTTYDGVGPASRTIYGRADQFESFDTIAVAPDRLADAVTLAFSEPGSADLKEELVGRSATVTGTDGDDGIGTSNGTDTIMAGRGNDWLRGGVGADYLDGGEGNDTASYAGSSAGVTINLSTGAASGGDATGDTLAGIESLIGSDYADTLTGTDYANVFDGGDAADALNGLGGDDQLTGGRGTDTIDGGGGNDTVTGGRDGDTLIGGSGIDTVSYVGSWAGVTVNLTTGAASGGDATGDTLSGFESLTGSDYADQLTGDAGANRLEGGGGDDTLAGLAGADQLVGGAGTDTATYFSSAAAVIVNLVSAIGTAGDAQGDTFSSIENLRGSAFADSLLGSHDANRLEGGDGNDMLSGRNGADQLIGGNGVDTASYDYSTVGVTVSLTTNTGSGGEAQGDTFSGIESLSGSAYADSLTGDAVANRLDGNDGDDTLAGLAGPDVLSGGAGIDTANYAASSAGVTVNLVSGIVGGGDAQGDTLSSIENVTGSSLVDALYGSHGANRLDGGVGNDLLSGRGGADQLVGGAGTDTATYVYSTAGVTVNLRVNTGSGGEAEGDTFSSIENLTGSDYADSLTGDSGINILEGGNGDDLLTGGSGADTLNGAGGIDTASYASSWAAVNASLESGTGSGGEAAGDTYAAIENLTGSIYGDTLVGNAGANRLAGGDGDDVLAGRAGADQLVGGQGSDTASYYTSAAAVSVSLSLSTASGGDAAGDTLSSIENLTGSANADTLTGDLGANRIDGGQGADRINGAAGMDRLTGGSGNDTFVFNQPLGPTNIDAITDFAPGFDAIQLAKSVFSALQGGAAPGSLSPNAFRYSTAASTSGGLGEIIYNATTGSLLYDADGAGTGAAQQFATLSSGLALSASAFKLA